MEGETAGLAELNLGSTQQGLVSISKTNYAQKTNTIAKITVLSLLKLLNHLVFATDNSGIFGLTRVSSYQHSKTAELAQLAERTTLNRVVEGSIPSFGGECSF